MEIGVALQQMVQDLDSVLGIPANAKIVNEEDPESGIVLQLFNVFGHVLSGQAKELVHHIAVVTELAAVIQAAGFVTQGRSEVRLSGAGFPVDPNVQPRSNETERFHQGTFPCVKPNKKAKTRYPSDGQRALMSGKVSGCMHPKVLI